MGFVQFPGSGTEPAKSGPAAAQQLHHLHQEYLEQFDKIYVQSVLQKRGFLNAQAQQAQNQNLNQGTNPQGGSNNNVVSSPGQNMPGGSQVAMVRFPIHIYFRLV